MRILIVDDDPKLRSFVSRGLTELGHECQQAHDGETALERLREDEFDLVLLDVMLPGIQGWDVMEAVRRENGEIPVLWVTARDAIEERVRGLRMGGDDYIVKPFAFEELLARIEVAARRRRPILEIHGLRLDPLHGVATREGRTIELTRSEMQFVLALAEAHGRPVSREELLKKVWNMSFDPGTNVVEVLVRRVRLKLDAPFEKPLIHTVRGEGYALREAP